MTPVIKKYEKELIEDGVLTQDEWNNMKNNIKDRLNDAYVKSKDYKYDLEDWMTKEWEEIKKPERHGLDKDTGISVDHLK